MDTKALRRAPDVLSSACLALRSATSASSPEQELAACSRAAVACSAARPESLPVQARATRAPPEPAAARLSAGRLVAPPSKLISPPFSPPRRPANATKQAAAYGFFHSLGLRLSDGAVASAAVSAGLFPAASDALRTHGAVSSLADNVTQTLMIALSSGCGEIDLDTAHELAPTLVKLLRLHIASIDILNATLVVTIAAGGSPVRLHTQIIPWRAAADVSLCGGCWWSRQRPGLLHATALSQCKYSSSYR